MPLLDLEVPPIPNLPVKDCDDDFAIFCCICMVDAAVAPPPTLGFFVFRNTAN